MSGIDKIAAERKRQVEKEGFDAAHDSEHGLGQLAMAAACYAAPRRIYEKSVLFLDPWPWDAEWDKRSLPEDYCPRDPRTIPHEERIDHLAKAGALIAAEIDRLVADGES